MSKPYKHLSPWTAQDDETLRRLYRTIKTRVIAKQMGRTLQATQVRIRKIKLSTRKLIPWTDADRAYVKKHFSLEPLGQIADTLHRTPHAVQSMASKVGATNPKTPWSAEDISYIKEHYGQKKPLEIAATLHRTPQLVMYWAKKLGKTKPVIWKLWSEADTDFLRANVYTMTHREIAAKLGRTVWAISRKAFNMGLLKKGR